MKVLRFGLKYWKKFVGFALIPPNISITGSFFIPKQKSRLRKSQKISETDSKEDNTS